MCIISKGQQQQLVVWLPYHKNEWRIHTNRKVHHVLFFRMTPFSTHSPPPFCIAAKFLQVDCIDLNLENTHTWNWPKLQLIQVYQTG